MHWMHHDAQKLSTVGFPRSELSFSVGVPLNPSNVQSGRAFPKEVKLWGVHAGKGSAETVCVHAIETARVEITRRRRARTDRLCRNRAASAGRRQPPSPVATVATG